MDEVILAECSDEEEFSKCGLSHGHTWSPHVQDVEALYQRLKNEKVVEFLWKCPGRRNPGEENKATEESEKPAAESLSASGAYDFDFDDDPSPVVPQKLTPKSSTPKLTTKKRTTLAGIVANMEKHRIMDKMGSGSGTSSPTKNANT